MHDLIFLLGAQGSGKTTIARLLKEKLNSPYIDFDWIRDFHLNKSWSNANDSELEMSLENLVSMLRNYKKHSYHNVIVSGLSETEIGNIVAEFKDKKYIIITLFLTNEEELKKRVLTESRDSGFRDFSHSIALNRKLRGELTFPHEHKIDNTSNSPEITANQIKDILLA